MAELERDSYTHAVTVRLGDSSEFYHEVQNPKGDPRNPFTQEESAAKFRDCAHRSLSSQNTERCLDLVSNPESLKDISLLMDTIT